jgi:cobalt-zinc-cadmium efflux system membrane fusion protein
LETIAAGDLTAEVLSPGRVAATPKGQAMVTANVAGKIIRLNKQLGEAVKAGEALATVESRDAAAIAADRAVANAKLDQARKAAAREQQLFDQRVSPRQDLEAAQAALAVAEAEARRANNASSAAKVSSDGRSVLVVSPIAGRITSQSAELGAFVQPETQLFAVADPKQVQIEAAVTAADAARISAGDSASVRSGSGSSVPATVRSVTPTLDAATRSATVVLTLSQPLENAAPGEAVQVRISPKGAEGNAFLIPEEAIQRVDGRDVVFVHTDKGFTVLPVVVSARSGGRASIASGLTAAQVIATRNAFLLKAQLGAAAGEDE